MLPLFSPSSSVQFFRVQTRRMQAFDFLATVLDLGLTEIDEAQAAIDQAIDIVGERDFVLDTRGIVKLAAGKVKEVENDFRRSIASGRSTDKLFQVAQALDEQSRTDEARETFQLAQRMGNLKNILHPMKFAACQRTPKQYQRAAAVLFPISWCEPCSWVGIEAQASGTPIIGTRYGYLPELVRDGETGFLVDTVKEAAAATDRIGELDPGACRANVEARFSVQVMAAGYERVYRTLIGETD